MAPQLAAVVVGVGGGVVAGGRSATPSVASVRGSNSTGIGVSVRASQRSPSATTFTAPLSVMSWPGVKSEATRRKAERQGSVANSR